MMNVEGTGDEEDTDAHRQQLAVSGRADQQELTQQQTPMQRLNQTQNKKFNKP